MLPRGQLWYRTVEEYKLPVSAFAPFVPERAMSVPEFSVVIPTYHRNDLLALCLERLAPGAQSLASDRYEVIVSDDGSRTTARELLASQFPWARWVEGPQQGPAANRNNGAKTACGAWLVFTDDDCLPDRDWLREYAAAATPEAIALEGSIHPGGEMNFDLADCPVNTIGNLFWSANIAVRRDVFFELGGFDTNYPLPALEDMDLHLRLKERAAIPFVSRAQVVHPVRQRSFQQAVSRLPALCGSWAYHTRKNQQRLGYPNRAAIVLDGYKFHAKALLNSVRRWRWREAVLAGAMLTYGVPLTAYRLLVPPRS